VKLCLASAVVSAVKFVNLFARRHRVSTCLMWQNRLIDLDSNFVIPYFLVLVVAMQARPMPSCGVCLSVTFVDSVKVNKRILKFFSPSGSHTILVFFSVLNVIAIFRRGPPNRGVKCRWGRQKSRLWLSIDDCCSANNNCDGGRCSLPHRAPRISEYMFITTSVVDDDVEKRTGHNLIVRSRESEAELALHVYYTCTIEATDRHEARAASLRQLGYLFVLCNDDVDVDSNDDDYDDDSDAGC